MTQPRIDDDMAAQIFEANHRLRACERVLEDAKAALKDARDSHADAASALADLIAEAESGQKALPFEASEEAKEG